MHACALRQTKIANTPKETPIHQPPMASTTNGHKPVIYGYTHSQHQPQISANSQAFRK